MARTGKLSAIEVTKAKGPAVLHDGGGLYLRVSATDAKSWVFRFQLDGKRRDMGLGPFPDISLSDAREKATDHRKLRHAGIDPLDAKEVQRQAQRIAVAKGRTFRECAAEFIERNRVGWRNAKHRQQWENTLATYVYPTFGELPVSAIDTGLVVQVLDPIWAEKPETASRIRGRIEERQTRPYPSAASQGAEGRTSCRAAPRRYARVPCSAAAAAGYGGTGVGIHDPDGGAHRRGARRALGRD